jgi:hypothetical protein
VSVIEQDGSHWVTSLGWRIVGPFATNADAWAWIERRTDEGWDDTERYNRIRMAMNGSYEPGI